MNIHGMGAIYRFEMARAGRTLWQSLVTPVITTALYFVVFGAAIGRHMADMDGVSFGSFIVPGLTQFPSDAPARECLVRVGETQPAGAFGTYRLWMTAATLNTWATRAPMSNEDLDTAFVFGTNRVIYNAGAHYSGSSSTAQGYDSPLGVLSAG